MKIVCIIILCILALFSFNYGIDVMVLKSGTIFFVIWFIIGFFLLCLAFLWYKDLIKKIPKTIKIIFLVLLTIGLSFFTFVEVLIFRGINTKPDGDYDYLLVLGAQVKSDGPASVLKYRLDAAIEYLVVHEDTKVIVSGGKGVNEPMTEAQGMKEYLVKKGIDEERILMEDQSSNTIENIQNSMSLYDIKDKKIGIVTSNFHLYRATSIAKKQGMENVSGISAYSTPYYLPHNCLREFVGIMKDTLFGNM